MVDLAVAGLGPGELIGGGASSSVFAATRLSIGDRVAVKVLKQTLTDEQSRSHFEREARALTELADIPGVVAVLDSGINVRGEPYLVFPLFEQSAQGDVTANGAMDPARAARIVAGAAKAVHGGHLRGVIHRDIKPANLLLTNSDDIFVSDFGIAKLTDSSVSASGWLGLTPAYAPPEALEGLAAGVLGDVYSLGATLAALVIGAPPFSSTGSESPIALLNRVVNQPAPDLASFGAPPDIAAAVIKAMAKQPSDRYQSALEFATALEQIGQGDQPSASTTLPAFAPPPAPAAPAAPPVTPPPAAAPQAVTPPPVTPPPAAAPQAVTPPPVTPPLAAAPPAVAPPPVTPPPAAVPPVHTPAGSPGGRNKVAVGAAIALAIAALVGGIAAFGGRGGDVDERVEATAVAVPESTVGTPADGGEPTTDPTAVRRETPTAVPEPTAVPAPTVPALPAAIEGGPLDVYPDGSGEVANLTAAVARSRDGDVIRLGPGRFEIAASIRVRTDITIVGAGIGETVLVATDSSTVLQFGETAGRLQNLSVTSTFEEEDSFGLIEVSASPSMVIDSVEIADSPGFGLTIIGSTIKVTNSQFVRNRLSGVGIGETSNVAITSNRSAENGQNGFLILDDSQAIFMNNEAVANEFMGFSAQGGGSPEFLANQAIDNSLNGFQFMASTTPTLRGNRSTGNGESGFAWFDSAAGTAVGNRSEANELAGFSMNNQSSPALTANTALGNSESGFLWSATASGQVVGNRSEANELNGFAVLQTSSPQLRANTAADNSQGDILQEDDSAATIDESGVIRVEIDGTGDAADLATAISRASAGDVIRLGPGVHQAATSISVTTDLTLIGAGPSETTIEVTGQNNALQIENTPIRVLDMTLTTSFQTDSDTDRFSVIEIDTSAEFTVDNVVVVGSVGIGVGVFGSTGTITNAQVVDSFWSGIGLSESAQVQISGVEAVRNGQSGIVFFGDSGGAVGGNSAFDNTFFGFSVQGQGRPEFSGNVARSNRGSGFGAAETASPTLVGNASTDNGDSGFIWIDTAMGIATANRAENNATSGFNMAGASSPSLTSNRSDGNEVDGFTWFETSSGTAVGNIAQGNVFDGFAAEGQSTPTLDRNAASGNERRAFNQASEATPTLTDNEFG